MNALITGGAGFIGSNLASRLLKNGNKVIIYDNFSRPNVGKNINWLRKQVVGTRLQVIEGDIRDFEKLKKYTESVDVIFHLAAQVAVTTSVSDPREDFEINALGTLNVLEAVKMQKKKPIIIYSSTNKVYGHIDEVSKNGVNEDQPLDFYSPYGCSKGSADQYVRDYARIYNLSTVVFRQSCVYGPRQFGVEDQGWLAHFVIKAINNEPITIFGDGKQIRDLLYIDDLIDAYLLAIKKIKKVRGEVINIGGGVKNSLSLKKSLKLLEKKLGKKIKIKYKKIRPGDQKVFISDNSKAESLLGFGVKTSYSDGLEKLIKWLQEEKN